MNIPSLIPQSSVVCGPFPHILAEDLLSGDDCRQLAEEFPSIESFTLGRQLPGHRKIRRTAPNLLADPRLSPRWRQMIEEHLQPKMFRDVVQLFGEHVLREHPTLETQFGPLESLKCGVRGRDTFATHDVLLDSELVLHTPVTGDPCIERHPHIKRSNKLFEIHVYFPRADDAATGTDIEVYQVRPGVQPLFQIGRQTSHEYLRMAESVRYRPGTVMGILNTARSVTQVAMRGPSPHPMQYFIFLAEFSRELFQLPKAIETLTPACLVPVDAPRDTPWWKRIVGQRSARKAA